MTTSSHAAIHNVALCVSAIEQATNRRSSLPGLVCFYGGSGLGKSFAASYACTHYRAYYIQCKSTWTKKAFLQAILKEMGIIPAKTINEMNDQICEELMLSGRPLIIDEADYLADKERIFMVMDIYEGSHAAILLIGEEQLPHKLAQWEKIDNRVLQYVPAQPASARDVQLLTAVYCPGIELEPALLEDMLKSTKGIVRRICVNLDRLKSYAAKMDLQTITTENWDKQAWFTGKPPKRRTA